MTPRRSPPEGGFTLIEMMVVIAIISVLAVLAIVNLKGRPGISETASYMSNSLREASRKAISGGVVDQVLVQSVGGVPDVARTRLRVRYVAPRQIITVETRDEAPNPDVWLELSSHVVHEDVAVAFWEDMLALNAGTSPSNAIQYSGSAGASEKSVYFAPDGTSIDATNNAQPVTLFLTGINTSQPRQLRVVVLPLQASALMFSSW